MANPLPALTSADHALFHTVGWLVTNIWADDPNVKMMRAELRELLPLANPGHPLVAAFITAGHEILQPKGGDTVAGRHAARAAVLQYHMGRAAAALAVLKGQPDAA
jgi:hypothetical protein